MEELGAEDVPDPLAEASMLQCVFLVPTAERQFESLAPGSTAANSG